MQTTNPGLWAASGWFSVHCPWRKPAVLSQVLSLRNLVSKSKAVDECVLWVTFSSFAVQVIHIGMSAASQHCFETASCLRTHAVPVIFYYHPLTGFFLNGLLKLCQWQLKLYRDACRKMEWSFTWNEVIAFSLNYSFSGKAKLMFLLFCFVCKWIYTYLCCSSFLPGPESVGKKSCCSISQSQAISKVSHKSFSPEISWQQGFRQMQISFV